MSYNFDPDRWYENHRALLEARKDAGDLDDKSFEEAVETLDREYDEMVTRLDGTFQLPK